MNRPVLALTARTCSVRSLQAAVQSLIIIFTFPPEMETLQSSTCLPVVNVSASYSCLFSGLHIHLTEMAKDVEKMPRILHMFPTCVSSCLPIQGSGPLFNELAY